MQTQALPRVFAEDIPQVETGLYRHFEGDMVEVLMTGLNTDSHEETVVYRSTGSALRIYVTPLRTFLGAVAHGGAREVPRFQRVREKIPPPATLPSDSAR